MGGSTSLNSTPPRAPAVPRDTPCLPAVTHDARDLESWVLPPTSSKYIHPNEITIAEGLKNQGYQTAFFGKWHLGNPNSANSFTSNSFPLAHGFDTWEGTNVSNDYDPGANLIRSDPNGTTPIAGYTMVAEDILYKQPLHEELTKRYRERALQFISDQKEHPFLLYLAPNMPHLPVHASSDFKGRSLRGLYGDCIEEIDAMVGALLVRLEDEGGVPPFFEPTLMRVGLGLGCRCDS